MLISKEIEVVLHGHNIQYYRNLGYELPYHYDNRDRKVISGEKILVKIQDIPCKTTKIKFEVKCDYCGVIYYPVVSNYYRGHKELNKDACNKCIQQKTKEINLLKYKTNSMIELSKIKKFHLGRYSEDGESVYEFFINKNVVPLFSPNEYNDAHQLLPFICEKHKDKGIMYKSYSNLKHKKVEFGCKYCNFELKNINQRYSYTYIDNKFKEKDYKLLSDNYLNVDDKLSFICNKHKDKGIQLTTFWSILHYTNNCKYCRYEMQSGDLHYNWMGGLTTENELIRKSQQYENWRLNIFQRDKYTCQCCFINGGNLNAHHIENFSTNEELRFDINNGITLCESCHSVNIPGSFHYVYGAFNNNKKQLEEYIKRHKNAEFDSLRLKKN